MDPTRSSKKSRTTPTSKREPCRCYGARASVRTGVLGRGLFFTDGKSNSKFDYNIRSLPGTCSKGRTRKGKRSRNTNIFRIDTHNLTVTYHIPFQEIKLARKRHGPIECIIRFESLVHRIPVPTLVCQPDSVARGFARRVHVVRRVQPRVGSTEDHLSEIVEAVVDVVPCLGLGRSHPTLARRRGRRRRRRWVRDDGHSNAIETMERVKHGYGVRTWLVVWPDEHESVVPFWDKRGPFEVGKRAVDGVVHRFFSEERDGAGVCRDVEVEELERGEVSDSYCVETGWIYVTCEMRTRRNNGFERTLTGFSDGRGPRTRTRSLEHERDVEHAKQYDAQLDERERCQ